jgi:hypothetical protein
VAFVEDVVDYITGEVSHIGLSTDGSTEISGGGYVHLAPNYAAAASGAADITATLEFSGTANSGPVTHLIFKRAGVAWTIRPVTSPASFNSDGRLDVTSAPVTAAFVA